MADRYLQITAEQYNARWTIFKDSGDTVHADYKGHSKYALNYGKAFVSIFDSFVLPVIVYYHHEKHSDGSNDLINALKEEGSERGISVDHHVAFQEMLDKLKPRNVCVGFSAIFDDLDTRGPGHISARFQPAMAFLKEELSKFEQQTVSLRDLQNISDVWRSNR